MSSAGSVSNGHKSDSWQIQFLVKTEATITATVIEHSLRIRAKSGSKVSQASSTAPTTATLVANTSASRAMMTTQEAPLDKTSQIITHSPDSTAGESGANAATPDSTTVAKPTSPSADPEKSQGGKDSFVGRTNNLVTSDAANIWNGCRDICAACM